MRDLPTQQDHPRVCHVRWGQTSATGPRTTRSSVADGSTVAFDSLANNLDPSYTGLDPFGNSQVYASTLNSTNDTVSTTKLVSIDPTGHDRRQRHVRSALSSLSDNGQMVAFQSAAEPTS